MARHETGKLLARGRRRPDLSIDDRLDDAVDRRRDPRPARLHLPAAAPSRRPRPRRRRPSRRRASGWRTTLASIGDAVVTTDVDGRVTNLNAVAESLTGWSRPRPRASRSSASSRSSTSDRGAGREPGDARLARGPGRRPREPHAPDQEGRRRAPIDDSAAPIRDERRARSSAASSSFATSSERKASELALARRRGRACSGSSRDMAIPTMVYAEDGTIVLVNRAWTRHHRLRQADELTLRARWTRRAYGARAAMMNTVSRRAVRADREHRQRRARDHDRERREADLALHHRAALGATSAAGARS